MTFKKLRITDNKEGSTHYKRWESDCGFYRIEWRDRIMGVKLDPAWYRAAVKRTWQNNPVQWIKFNNKKHRTFEAAVRSCEEHKKRYGMAQQFHRPS